MTNHYLRLRLILTALFVVKLTTELRAQTYTKSMLRVPDTGQKNSYTSTFGEDNDYTINWPYFIKHNDGTCTDTVTGLMWQILDGGEMTIENARTYCDTLQLGNYSDWRLPTPLEAYSILNHQNNNPALDINIFTKTAAEYWWTSVSQTNDITKIWCINAGGGIGNHPKSETISAGGTKKFHVRAVRDKTRPLTLNNRFIDNGDGSISDLLTDLKWQKTSNASALSWEDALIYAERLVLGNDSNWRLPNIKELQSLHDADKISPCVNSMLASNAGNHKFWSSTSLPNQTTKAWYWETQIGITTYDLKTNLNYVWCVSNQKGQASKIEAKHTKESIQAFPNPFHQFIILSDNIKNTYLRLYSQDGRCIYKGEAIEKQDFSSLEDGIYWLMTESNKSIKIIKTH